MFRPIEDATVGIWRSALDLRQADHAQFHLQSKRPDC